MVLDEVRGKIHQVKISVQFNGTEQCQAKNAHGRFLRGILKGQFCSRSNAFLPVRLAGLLKAPLSVLQAPLKGSVCGAIRTVLRSYTDVCNAVFVLEIGLRFLAKTGGDPQGQLLSFLTDSLKLDSQVSSSVAKVGTSKVVAVSIPMLLCQEC